MEYSFDSLLDRFVKFAEYNEDIRLVMVIGSRARTHAPADVWSDLDLVFFTSDPSRFLENDSWLSKLGWKTF